MRTVRGHLTTHGQETKTVAARAARILAADRAHRRYAALLAALAAFVAVFVCASLTQGGTAATHEERVLDCSYAGNGAHTHDESCYDADGNLVCPLEERELHTHDDSCYEDVLVCGLDESEGHAHTDECYDESGELVCGLDESESHEHGESCYERVLVCEQEEVTEEHVHGPGCFRTVTVDDGEDSDGAADSGDATDLTASGDATDSDSSSTDADNMADPTGLDDALDSGDATVDDSSNADIDGASNGDSDGADAADADVPRSDDPTESAGLGKNDSVARPAQTLEGNIVERDEDGRERVTVAVLVEAPEGALPEGSTVRVEPLGKKATRDALEKAVAVVRKEMGEDASVWRAQMASISFRDADGEMVEPAREVTVRLNATLVAEAKDPVLVHVANPDTDRDESQDKSEGAEVVEEAKLVNWDENDSSVGSEDTIEFSAGEPNGEFGKESADGVSDSSTDGSGDSSAVISTDGSNADTTTGDNPAGEPGADGSATSSAIVLADGSSTDGPDSSEPAASFSDSPDASLADRSSVEGSSTGDETAASTAGEPNAASTADGSDTGEPGAADPASAASPDASPDTYVVCEVETISAGVVAADGSTWSVEVSYPAEAAIPEGAELRVTEIAEGSPDHDDYVERAVDAVGESVGFARFFDIAIVKDGEEVQPKAPVSVSVRLADASLGDDVAVVHFAEAGPEVLESTAGGDEVAFETDGFSVYAIVDAPEPIQDDSGWKTITSLDDFSELASSGIYVYNAGGYYFTNQIDTANNRSGIKKTKPAASSPDHANAREAVPYYFEKVTGTTNQFYAYCYGPDNTTKQYVRHYTNNLAFSDKDNATIFTITENANGSGTFFVSHEVNNTVWYWNMQGSAQGNRFCAWNAANADSQISFCYHKDPPFDPYELDGTTWSIAYHDENVTSTALTTVAKTVSGKQRLEGIDLIMRRDVLDNDGVLLVSEGSDIDEWTFTCVGEDKYNISTQVDGAPKYLTIRGTSVTLEDSPDPTSSAIRVVPGVDANSGKYHLTVGNYSLSFEGSAQNGFGAVTGSAAKTWMNFVQKTNLNDDDFRLYRAQKVSVSDEQNVYNGQQVVIYTRIWNDTTKRYEFYAVDHDGSLIHCYDTGDAIEWLGSTINSALWDFTEYYDPGTTNPNYYYELVNSQYDECIAPQVSSGQIVQEGTMGINLNGRRYGRSYTSIIAWDEDNYTYSGLKVENGRVVACALSEADDFYFAVMVPVEMMDELTTVDTVDNTAYGITMKMVDFNNRIQNERDSGQTRILGLNTNDAGLLDTHLDENGYPLTNPAKTGKDEASLEALYGDSYEVNHLFLQSIYNESGYFEYNSTQNFATLLDADGNPGTNFTVYDQLGAIVSSTNGPTRTHGQFMPYDDLTPGEYCPFTNQTDVLAHELPDNDPRKGEKLYKIGMNTEVDYFHGMEMEASFTQTESGLDAWGHDIIFEFSGDDDFWLYVDDELVLDLGGVHSAMAGSANFRTGQVTSSRAVTIYRGGSLTTATSYTLREVFEGNYRTRNPNATDDEVAAFLGEYFEDGETVFKDYTVHKMRIFYMERGAGASNLWMRFNLASVKQGAFLLSKKLSGTEKESNDLIEFPYQIYYAPKGSNQFRLLGETAEERMGVTYRDSSKAVTYAASFTPAGGTDSYDHVFFLKPGEQAEVLLPIEGADYYVVECGVNPDVYDGVTANGDDLTGTPTNNMVGGTPREDYAVGPSSIERRPRVDYINNVDADAMRTLEITKRLYDVDGQTLLEYPADTTEFKFRLYLGNESADPDNLPLANNYSYLVKDADGNYCRWDISSKKFVTIEHQGSPISDYGTLSAYLDTLTAAQRDNVVFTTSMNGTISRIPADHTIEVRDLIVDTQYKVEERAGEIPKGYTLRLEDGYTRVDDGHSDKTGTTPYSGTIDVGESPEVEVRNQKGWGLTVQKIWSDKDFMAAHDSIYFAVYVRNGSGSSATETMVADSVRVLKTTDTSIYYFFWNLGSEIAFRNYVVYEVELTGDYTVDDEGVVDISAENVHPIADGGTLRIDGQPVGGSYSENDSYAYTVTYQPGDQTTQNENVRTDKVTNSRPGIKLYKTTWDGSPLAGAVFSLKDDEGNNVAADSYTSEDDGLVTIAYVLPGTYTLTETVTPKGYVALDNTATITVADDDNNTVTVDGIDGFYTVEQASSTEMATITIKNRTTAFEAKKIDARTEDPIADVHFALYYQVTNDLGEKVIDNLPIPGYEDIVTDAQGMLPEIALDNLRAGRTYYLVETEAVEGYEKLGEAICFAIGNDGTVRIESEGDPTWLAKVDDGNGHVTYTLTIPNGQTQKVKFVKADILTNDPLAGAVFDLYALDDEGNPEDDPMFEGMTSNTDGFLECGESDEFDLPMGKYHMVETRAPNGYNSLTGPVVVVVSADDVTYDDGTSQSVDGTGKSVSDDGVYTLTIVNSPGYELPQTGGVGTVWVSVLGGILMTGSAIALLLRRREA